MIIRKFGDHPIPGAVLDAVKKETGYKVSQTDIVNYQGHGLVDSYKRSVNSIANSFEYLCNALKYKDVFKDELINKLINYNKKLEKKYIDQLKVRNKINDYQNVLQEYLTDMLYLLTEKLQFKETDALKFLTKADEYALLNVTRPILATVTSAQYLNDGTGKNETGYLIQMEVPQPVLDKIKVQEFLNAKPNSVRQPEWYKAMSDNEKILFDYLMRDVKSVDDVVEKIQSISSRHRSIPGVANFSKHVMFLLDNEGKMVYQSHHRYRSSMIASRDVAKTNKELRVDFAYHNLCEIIRNDIEQFLEENKNRYKFIDSEGYIDRSKVEKFLAERITNSPILIQTLITPLPLADKFVPDPALYEDKLEAVKKLLKEGLSVSLRNELPNKKVIIEEFNFIPKEECLIETNHPLNKARNLAPTSSVMESGDTKNNSMKLVVLAKQGALKLKTMINDDKAEARLKYADLLEMAATDLENLLNTNIVPVIGYFFEKNQRELHLAALEELMTVRLNGISYGSCVSGKDRKGLQTMYVDAMEIYYQLYKEFPKYDDVDDKRRRFVDIYAQLFLTQHQQMNAGQNAIGADGIKTPAAYLPKDIQLAIAEKSGNPTILSEVDRLASNNEFHKMVKGLDGLSPDRIAMLNSDFKAFNSEIATVKIDLKSTLIKIIEIINHPNWKDLAVGVAAPEGIQDLRKIINDPLMLYLDAVSIIKFLADACQSRPTEGKHRKSNTRDFYNSIMVIAANIDELNTGNTADLDRIYKQFQEKEEVAISAAASSAVGVTAITEVAPHPLIRRLNQHEENVELKVDDKNYMDFIKNIIVDKFWDDKGKAVSGPQLFSKKSNRKVPSGISKMQDFLKSTNELDTGKLIDKFVSFIKKKDDKNRAFCTKQFYDILTGLRDNKGMITPELIKALNAFVLATDVSLKASVDLKNK